MINLTHHQQCHLDDILVDFPEVTSDSVQIFYQPSYARSYWIYIGNPARGDYLVTGDIIAVITKCDWKHTAENKADEVRAFITQRLGVQS